MEFVNATWRRIEIAAGEGGCPFRIHMPLRAARTGALTRRNERGPLPMRREFLVMALALVAGCANLPRPVERVPEPVPSADTIHAAQLTSYARDLQQVVSGSSTAQAEVIAQARAAYERERQGGATLRYALLLAAPLHPARDPALAQQLLRECLARPEQLSPVERALAAVELERIGAELSLAAENERLVAETRQARDRARDTSATTALTRQVQMLTEQNAQLRNIEST